MWQPWWVYALSPELLGITLIVLYGLVKLLKKITGWGKY